MSRMVNPFSVHLGSTEPRHIRYEESVNKGGDFITMLEESKNNVSADEDKFTDLLNLSYILLHNS